jgi:tRNA nucleotidyltransferase (CCA-adding enzyme)
MRNLKNINETLTADEKEVFSILLKVAAAKSPSTTLRVAGGWVRDHLLGVPSDDIDIMVDNISGETFAKMVTESLGSKDAHVIRENPDKSKHVETAKAYLPLSSGKTQEIDFARARQEVYHDNSRIPDIRPATAREDAHRRDLTINSLFYNLTTRQIEDFTGKGVQDLITNTMRTPVDPLRTFKDDPLRIFRVIRFAAKYKGNLDPATYQAMQDPSLKEEIKQKISKERIGTEMKKMFSNPNAEVAITLLKDTGLLDDIMSEALKGTKYEGKMAPLEMDQNNPNHKLNWWSHTFQVLTNVLEKFPQYEGEKRVIMVLAALTHDMGKLFDEIRVKKPGTEKYPGHADGYTTYVGHEEESYEIVQHILRYLKLEPYIQQVAGLARYHMMPHSLVRDSGGDKALRKFIRRMGEFSLNWLDVLNLSIADAYSKAKDIDPEVVKEYQELEQRLQAAMASLSPEATATPKIKPILDGNEIMTILGVKPGPHMKEMGEFVKELMDENPNITKEEAAAKLKERFQAGLQTQASTKTPDTTCSFHVIQQKMMDLQELLDNGKTYEAMSVMNSLRESFGNDEKVTRLIAINTFKSLIKDSSTRDNDLVQYVFDKATENFFDSILNAYAFGILLITKTSTGENTLREVGSRVLKMSPGTLRFVLDMLPQEKIINQDTANFIRGQLNENYQRK